MHLTQMILFYQPHLNEGADFLDHEESKHCVKVLRSRKNDLIYVTDGKGSIYECQVTDPDPKKCKFKKLKINKTCPTRNYYTHIAISPTKNTDRVLWFIEKAVEYGIDEISFLQCDHSERGVINIERVKKKAISAIKQSLTPTLPIINEIVKFDEFISYDLSDYKNYIAHKTNDETHLFNTIEMGGRYCIIIGPEGGFSNREIALSTNKEFKMVTLGDSRLRTESAALLACMVTNTKNIT